MIAWEEIYSDPKLLMSIPILCSALVKSITMLHTIDDIIATMTKHYKQPDTVFAVAQQAGIAQQFIQAGPAAVDVINGVVEYSVQKDKLEELIDAIAMEHPEILTK